MKKIILTTLIWFISLTAFSQITVTNYNAEWNSPNKVEWVEKLSDCDIAYVDIAKSPDLQQKNNVVVIPTIIIFQDGEEVKRFQADLSFKMVATKEEVQEEISNQLMSDF